MSSAQDIRDSPPRAPPIQYTAPLGTRWAKEKAAAGGSAAFDLPTDPKTIGPWILGECIGKGASGRVKIARHQRTRQLAAVKILPIAPLVNSRASLATQQAKSEKQRLGIDREITMMKLMNHPNIMRIYDVYEGEKELFLVLEYVEGGELFDFLVNKGRLPPHEALIYFRQIIYGLNYAHTFSIIHRDLKPENILIASLNPPVIKIADWGMAAFAPPMLQLETSCGSPHYASPEIVNGEKYFGTATDIWSCGVILYALLTGRLPFDDKNVRTLLSKVKSGKYDTPTWVDPLAKDLLSKMLVVDVRKRLTIPEVMEHPWFAKGPASSTAQNETPLPAPPSLPPSPSTLARPIASPDLIDPELFASLRIIWGRHTDAEGTSIQRDLCSPAGQGVHAKAFYFLLDRYREESLRNRSNDGMTLDADSDRLHVGWDLEHNRGYRKPAEGHPNITVRSRGDKMAISNVGGYGTSEIPPSAGEDSVLGATQPEARASRRVPVPMFDPLRKRQTSHSYSSSAATITRTGTVNSANNVSLNYGHALAPRHNTTGSRRSAYGSGYSHSVSHTVQRSSREYGRAGDTAPASGPSAPTFPRPAMHHPDGDREKDRHSMVLSPASIHHAKMASQSAMDTDSPASAPIAQSEKAHTAQSTVYDIVRNITSDTDTRPHSTRPLSHSPRRLDNENAMDEGWTHVDANVAGRGQDSHRPKSTIPATREPLGRELVNSDLNHPHATTTAKKEKDRKSRPPPIEVPPLNHHGLRVSSFSPSIHSTTPSTATSSGAHKILASPVVGEFKGWFSNLFNWKTGSTPPSSVFYSGHDLGRTRDLTLRMFQGLTFSISRVIMNLDSVNDTYGSREIYHCRLDQAVVDSQHPGITLKPLKLRLEFSAVAAANPAPVPVSAPMVPPPSSDGNHHHQSAFGHSSNNPAAPVSLVNYGHQANPSPNYLAATPGFRPSSGRTSVSLGLGRTSSSHVTVGSTTSTSANTPATPLLQSHNTELPAGCSCMIVLTFEKGSSSTFRAVRQRLKDILAAGEQAALVRLSQGPLPPPMAGRSAEVAAAAQPMSPVGLTSPTVGPGGGMFGEGYHYQRVGM